jgi:general secretion pathway protein A
MYQQFFGLEKRPFDMTPDPAFLYLSAHHQEAVAGLAYAILSHKGCVVLTGEAGTGKTTVLNKVLNHLPGRIRSCVIYNPTLTPAEFFELVLSDFGITSVPTSKAQRIIMLRGLLLEARVEDKIAAITVDEAHKLSGEVLEEIRLLGNFEMPGEKLLQIVLSGQPELNDLLNREDMRQFKQRIALRLAIEPLTREEVKKYLAFRWAKAGAKGQLPFEPEAVERLTGLSHGIPRVLNALCDNAMTLAFSESIGIVTREHVAQAAQDLHISERLSPHANTPPLPTPQHQEAAIPAPSVIEAPAFRMLDRRPMLSRPSLLSRWTDRLGTE